MRLLNQFFDLVNLNLYNLRYIFEFWNKITIFFFSAIIIQLFYRAYICITWKHVTKFYVLIKYIYMHLWYSIHIWMKKKYCRHITDALISEALTDAIIWRQLAAQGSFNASWRVRLQSFARGRIVCFSVNDSFLLSTLVEAYI